MLAGYLRRVRNAARPLLGGRRLRGLRAGAAPRAAGARRARADHARRRGPGGPRRARGRGRARRSGWCRCPSTPTGIVVDALGEAGAVLVTPAHQSPTGVLLSARRRQELVAWARERDGMILEDDYDAELRYGDEPVGALQGLAPDRVVLLGSVSKSLAPGLRLGWVLCPPDAGGGRSPTPRCGRTAGRRCWTSWRSRGWSAPVGTTGTCAGCVSRYARAAGGARRGAARARAGRAGRRAGGRVPSSSRRCRRACPRRRSSRPRGSGPSGCTR